MGETQYPPTQLKPAGQGRSSAQPRKQCPQLSPTQPSGHMGGIGAPQEFHRARSGVEHSVFAGQSSGPVQGTSSSASGTRTGALSAGVGLSVSSSVAGEASTGALSSAGASAAPCGPPHAVTRKTSVTMECRLCISEGSFGSSIVGDLQKERQRKRKGNGLPRCAVCLFSSCWRRSRQRHARAGKESAMRIGDALTRTFLALVLLPVRAVFAPSRSAQLEQRRG